MPLPANRLPKVLPGYIATKAERLRYGGITVSGVPVATDATGMALLLGASKFFEINPTAPAVKFVVSPQLTVSLGKAAIDVMLAAVTAFVQATFSAEAQANAAMNAVPSTLTSLADVDAIFAAVSRAL